MTTFTAAPATTPVRPTGRARAARIGLWAARIALAAQFVAGGALKLTGDPAMVAMFSDIGAGQGLRLFIGACEVAGAIGLLVPRLARLAATGLVLLMVGATVTNVVTLQISPAVPLVLMILAAVVAVTRTEKGNAR
jgi:putative oxidoreductase